MSPTARTLKQLRKEGYACEVVERFNRFSNKRKDLFGVIDIVAIAPEDEFGARRIVGIQATSASNIAARVKKSKAEPLLTAWLLAGAGFEVWGWGKKKEGKRHRWRDRRVAIN